MTNNIETQRPKSAYFLMIVGILIALGGALCSLIFLMSYITDPILSKKVGTIVAAQLVCPLPILTIGCLLIAGGVYLFRHPEKAPKRTKTVPAQTSPNLASVAKEIKPSITPSLAPPPNPKIKSLVEEYLSRLRAFVWTDEIIRIEKEIVAQAEKALPVIKDIFETQTANGTYQSLQSGTSLVGLIAKIDSPEAVDLLCRIARRKNASQNYVDLITYTCIGELAKMAANGSENAKEARDSLAQEFSFLVPKINKYLRSQDIAPIEIS